MEVQKVGFCWCEGADLACTNGPSRVEFLWNTREWSGQQKSTATSGSHPTPAVGRCCASYPGATREQPTPPHIQPSKPLEMSTLTSYTHTHLALDRLRAAPLCPRPYLGEALHES